MTFGSPLMFWSFMALLPLVAIYLLKVRPRRKPTTAFFLWEKIFQEKRASSLMHRLRDLMSLLLMALAFSAVCLALTQPHWIDDERKDLLLIIDNSASMRAADGRSTRLERAKTRAAEIVQGLDGTQRAAVATVARKLHYASHLTDNPRELVAAIEAIKPSHEALRARSLPLRESNQQFTGDYRLLFLSDGCFESDELPDGIELIKIGREQQNVGLVAADLQFVPGGEDRLSFYFQVASSQTQATDVDLLLSYESSEDSQLAKVIPLTIEPGLNVPQVMTIEGARPGRWTASLDVDDALAKDNTAYLCARRPPPIPIAVESSDQFFFEQCVLAFSGEGGLLNLVEKDSQLVLAKSQSTTAERAIIFQPQRNSSWWDGLGEELDNVVPRVLVEDHPLIRHFDPASVVYLGARQLTAPVGAQVIVASESGVPLVFIANQSGKKAVVMNLDPVAAEFYFSAWFPVFVHSAALHLAGREDPLLATYAAGDLVPISGTESDSTSKVTVPGNETVSVRGKVFDGLDRLGFYQVVHGENSWNVGCSLLSTRETLLGNEAVVDTSQPISSGSSPAQWLTILALAVVTAESVLYHRRKVG